METKLKAQNESSTLTISEQVKACCTIAREKLEAGDYDEGCAALQRWWTVGEWPKHSGLEALAAAELLFTAGVLSGLVGSIKQTFGGQKPAEGLLNGAITLFERLGEKTRVAEARVELACFIIDKAFLILHDHFTFLAPRPFPA